MNTKYFSALLATLLFSAACLAQEDRPERHEMGVHFEKFNAQGAIVLVDRRATLEKTIVFNEARAQKRYSPASTYKIPHTLFVLDAGLVKDEFQVFPWDGVERGYAPHNQDQDLRSAVRNSALWLYELFAKELGEEKARNYLKKVEYGNADPRTEDGAYWVDGNLAISAYEQVELLQRLYRNELPFQKEHQLLLKDIMIIEAGRDWILRAKTGWKGKYGWFVGWVEWPEGPVFFALNIDTPNRWEDLYKREAIVREILRSIQALPPKESVQTAVNAPTG